MARGSERSFLSGKAAYFITLIILTLGFVALLAFHCVLRSEFYSVIFLFSTMLISFAINLLYDKFGFYASFALNFIQSMIYIYEIASLKRESSRLLLIGTFLIMVINLALQFYRVRILSQATDEREKKKKLRSDEISKSLEKDMNERPSLIANYNSANSNGTSVYEYSVMPHLDPLTTLPGRDMIRDKIDRMIMGTNSRNDNSSYTTDSKFMVIYLSIDNAPKLADITGNCNMDLFIQNISHRLREACDPSDMLARATDAQFIILSKRILPEDKLDQYIDKLTRRMLRALCAGLDSLPAVISYGTASYPNQGRDGGSLITHAEMNRKVCYDNTDKVSYPKVPDNKHISVAPAPSPSKEPFSFEGMSRDEIIAVFEEAISSGNLYMSYQPYYTADRKLRGIEAFLRLRKGEELVPPAIFLAAAEHAGYMNRIGSFSLEEALGVIARANGILPELKLNLNISASQFCLPDFIAQFNNAISNSDASIANLILDIPESTLTSERDDIRNTIEKLSGMGVRMALNNFGSGYSSFNTIPLLPVSVVKLDASFTSGIPTRSDVRILTSSVISVLQDIDISVCATGVENIEQYNYLAGAGCDYFQGTFMSEEVRGDRFIQSLS